jgi:hypothetical protein
MVLMMDNNEPKEGAIIGLPFYTEADWKIQCNNSVDDSGFKGYDEMRNHHERLKKDLEAEGYQIVDVSINASEMQESFDKNGLKNNSQNRSRYIADLLRKRN